MSQEDVRLIIASYGRPKHQITLRNLPEALLKRVELWVVPSQYKAYKAEGYKVKCITKWPDGIDAIFKKRKWLAKNIKEPFVMLDDDLQLMRWSKSANKYIIAKNDPERFVKVFENRFLTLLDKYDSIACAMKFMAEQHLEKSGLIKEGTPGYVVTGYNPGVCKEVDFTRTSVLSDMNQNIQILQQGKTSATFYGIVFSQSSAKALETSGCGTYRTDFMKIDAALRMLYYFSGIVTDFQPTKTVNGGGLKLIKYLGRLKTGVNSNHMDLSQQNRLGWIEKLGMDRSPKRIRWKMEEPVPDFMARLQEAWRDAGYKGKFDNIKLGSAK